MSRGNQTTDEMCIGVFEFVPADAPSIPASLIAPDPAGLSARQIGPTR
jgi:hypothetical protein